MYILAVIAIIIALAIGGLLLAASTRPKEIAYTRTTTTTASAAAVYNVFSDLGRWREWSPYDKRDPNMKTELSDPSVGVGARYAWEGNNDVGKGRMTIIQDDPGRSLDMSLEFDRPFKCNNHVEWRVDDEGEQRRISWSMDGKNDALIPRVIGLFMDMEKMVCKDFEVGLETLKGIAEKEDAAR